MLQNVGLASLKSAPSPEAAPDPSLLELLLEMDAESIETAHNRLSGALAARFQDPGLHEGAALLLGVFSLREASGDFYDVRHTLCRMTAHLAFARALRGPDEPGLEGQMAGVLLYALMGNQADALKRLEALATTAQTEPWKRALRAWITKDYRELDAIERRTPLEQVARFGAYARSVASHEAWEKLESRWITSRPDFCRLAWQERYSVELGHLLTRHGLALERRELERVVRLAGRAPPGRAELAPALNALPAPCVTSEPAGPAVRVISWGHWAQFLQRHLCHALYHQHRFFARVWCVPEYARRFAAEAAEKYGELRFFPFVQRLSSRTLEEYLPAVRACAQVVRDHPQWVPAALWNLLWEAPQGVPLEPAADVPNIIEWHRHNPPPHAAYRVADRLNHSSLVRSGDSPERFEALRRRAPYDPEIIRLYLYLKHRTYGEGLPVETLEAAYGPLLEYSVPVLQLVARRVQKDPGAFERFMSRAAERNGRYYFNLGYYFAERNDVPRAVKYYELGVARCRDLVAVASSVDWLVVHYFETGRVAEAERLADLAAEVYSYNGLKTKADLRFRQERYAESFDLYRQMAERYDLPNLNFNWWVVYRQDTGRADFDAEIEKRQDLLFPNGRQNVSLRDLRERPEAGVLVQAESEPLRAAGLKKGDIIVGLQGTRVDTVAQFLYLRTKLPQNQLNLLVWDGARYREVTVNLPEGELGGEITNYELR